MDTLRQDLVFAFRLLVKDRAFAATTILTLVLCIGANTAIFSVVRSVSAASAPVPRVGAAGFRIRRVSGRRRGARRDARCRTTSIAAA